MAEDDLPSLSLYPHLSPHRSLSFCLVSVSRPLSLHLRVNRSLLEIRNDVLSLSRPPSLSLFLSFFLAPPLPVSAVFK